jgi:hypothetical protein
MNGNKDHPPPASMMTAGGSSTAASSVRPAGVPSSSSSPNNNGIYNMNIATLAALGTLNSGNMATTPMTTATPVTNMPPIAHPNMFHGKGSFPLNLALMLESVEPLGLSHIVSWLPSGQSFVIHDPDQFLKFVLPMFFK